MIFAGGAGRRMGHINKSRLTYKDTTFGEKIMREVSKLGIPSFLSAAVYPWEKMEGWEIIEDELRDQRNQFVGPAGGLFSCLKRAEEMGLSGLYTAPCDMPFFHKEQMEFLPAAGDADAVVWQTRDGRVHPVCGYYKVSCARHIEKMVKEGNYRLRDLFDNISVKLCRTDEVHIPDRWFSNINHIKEYDCLQMDGFRPPVLAVSGKKNSGKTTLLVHILQKLAAAGLRCGVIKHDGHEFEADVPGTDSHKLKAAGAYGTAVYSGTKYSVTKDAHVIDCSELFCFFEDADLIFLEGQKYSSYPKIEVLRRGIAEHPLTDPGTVIAYVADGFEPDIRETGGKPVLRAENMDEILEAILVFADQSSVYRER